MKTIIKSLKHINHKLFLALLVMGLCPTVYITLRTFLLGQLPGEWSFSIALIPLYKPFMQYILNFDDVDKLFELVMVLLGFYVLFAVQNVFDSTFYGRGKTNYMLFESIVTNTLYYGTFFVLYLTGVWVPTLTGIALMFGIGNAFDSVVSGIAYSYYLKKNKLNILKVE